MATEDEEFEFRARAEKESSKPQQKMGGSPPLGFVAKQIWNIMPQNPKNLLNNAPMALGALGGASPIPGGAMAGTAMGQGIRYLGDKAFNQPVPSGLQHVAELGGAALGDAMAIPALKKFSFGKQVGAAEKAAGVPLAQDIPSIPMATGQKSAGEFINEAVDSVKGSGGQGAPTYWKQIKDQVDRIYQMGADQKLTTLDKGRLKWLNQQVQQGLNASVPGRGGPAAALAQSQTIPNMIGRAYKAVPGQFKRGAAYGSGAGAAGLASYELIKKLLGG